MNILEKNLTIKPFKTIYESLHDKIYNLETTKTDLPTYKIDNIYIHSKYDPVKEAKRTANILCDDIDNIDIYIILGGGLGFILSEVYDLAIKNNKRKIKPIIIYIEKDIASFITALSVTNFCEMANNENVKIFLDSEKEMIGSYIQSVASQKIKYYYHRPLYLLNENYYKDLQNYINYILDRKDMNTATITRFQKIWTRNMIYNISYLPECKKIADLKGVGKNSTAVIAAGGPTLEKMLPFIKKNINHILLIAVDTAYKFLMANGITPDITVCVDPQFWNYKYLENEKLENSILVTDPTTYYKIFRNIDSKRIFTGNSIFPLAGFFINNTDRGVLAAGGSVSTTAFDIARTIGSSNIILAGLDLGFPNKNTHFKGAFFETGFISNADYINTVEHKSFSYISHAGLLTVKSTSGIVSTDPKMVMFKKWFEREIPLSQCKVYLPDLGGSYIEGAFIIKYEELDSLIPSTNKDTVINNINSIVNQDTNYDHESIRIKINQFVSLCKSLKKYCNSLINCISENGTITEKNTRKFDELQNEISTKTDLRYVMQIVSSTAQDTLLSIMENIKYNEDENKSLWIKTRKLYETIFDMSIFHENIFSKILKIIK